MDGRFPFDQSGGGNNPVSTRESHTNTHTHTHTHTACVLILSSGYNAHETHVKNAIYIRRSCNEIPNIFI
jgi:hypothetical protein